MTDDKRIQERAYAIWEEAGRPDGQHDAHWSQAEREVSAGADGASPTMAAPDGGGASPAEAAAAVAAPEPGAAADTAPDGKADSASPTLAAPGGGGSSPADAAAAAKRPAGRRRGAAPA